MDPWGKIAKLSRSETRDLQNNKLRHFISNHLYPFSPHYRQLFDQNNINPKSIKTIEDLQRLPFSSKTDFVASDKKPKFKDFVLQPDQETIRKYSSAPKLLKLALTKAFKGSDYVLSKLSKEYRPIFMTFTTGTTNDPVPFVYTHHDIENLYTSGSRMLRLFAIDNSEHIVNMFPYAPHLAFWQVVFGGLSEGALILSTGGGKVMGTEGNIAAILKMKPSVILGVPSYVYHVLRLAREKGAKLDFIKKVVLGASRVTTPFKIRLASLLASMGAEDVAVFGTYGFTESRCAWAECPSEIGISTGYHLYPDKEILEVIDPETGDVKGEGEDGELVYTSIDARGSCVVRYRTGDFVKGGITSEPCTHCSRLVARISSDITRLSDVKDLRLSKVKGCLVNLNNFATALGELDEITEWQVEIRKKDNDPYEVDELCVYICAQEGSDNSKIQERVKTEMVLATEVGPNEIIFLPFDEMIKRLELETASKEKRILDSRPKG